MILFTHSRLYKDIGGKAFFTMATLLMPLLENACLSESSEHCKFASKSHADWSRDFEKKDVSYSSYCVSFALM